MSKPRPDDGETQIQSLEEPENSDQIDFGSAVGSIHQMLKDGSCLSTGDIAELRRISPEEPFTPSLWRILLHLDLAEPPSWFSRSDWETRWATLMMGMAHCAGLHDFNNALGESLAGAGWSELRFVRLMRADGETLAKSIRRVSEYLASKSQPANWTDMARLLFFQSGEAADDIRLSISRDYYRRLYAEDTDDN